MANNVLGGHGHQFMMVVGAVEIIVGIGVAVKPRVFAYIVALWLLLIIINLLSIPGYYISRCAISVCCSAHSRSAG